MTNAWAVPNNGKWEKAENWSSEISPEDTPWIPVSISGTEGNTVFIEKTAPSSVVIQSLTIGSNSDLIISAVSPVENNAFSVNSLDVNVNGSLTINTPSPVSLGANPKIDGTLTLLGNKALSINSNSISGCGSMVLDGATIGSSANMFVMGDGITTTLKNGASLYVNNGKAGKEVRFAGSRDGQENHLVFSGYDQSVSTKITGFDSTSVIQIAGWQSKPISAGFKSNGDGTYTLEVNFDQWGKGIFLKNITLAAGFSPGTASIVDTPDGGWNVVSEAACFLKGCLIKTSDGYRPVEDIRPGDKVMTLMNGEQEVVWCGQGRTTIPPAFLAELPLSSSSPSGDLAGFPVRINAGAISDGIPFEDMLVTSEHCLFLNDFFVPVRMLVNGHSIAYDKSITSYDYYHIETSGHSIIWSNGVPTETYLRSSNKKVFTGSHSLPGFNADRELEWGRNSAAPLVTCQHKARQIYDMLAGCQNNETTPPTVDLTFDAGLHLETDNGDIVRLIRNKGRHFSFMIPARTKSVKIISRSSRPCDTVGPFVDDRRNLGILVGEINYVAASGRDGPKTIRSHLDTERLDGWHAVESPGCRWTNGRAILPLNDVPENSLFLLSIQVLSAGPYLKGEPTSCLAA